MNTWLHMEFVSPSTDIGAALGAFRDDYIEIEGAEVVRFKGDEVKNLPQLLRLIWETSLPSMREPLLVQVSNISNPFGLEGIISVYWDVSNIKRLICNSPSGVAWRDWRHEVDRVAQKCLGFTFTKK